MIMLQAPDGVQLSRMWTALPLHYAHLVVLAAALAVVAALLLTLARNRQRSNSRGKPTAAATAATTTPTTHHHRRSSSGAAKLAALLQAASPWGKPSPIAAELAVPPATPDPTPPPPALAAAVEASASSSGLVPALRSPAQLSPPSLPGRRLVRAALPDGEHHVAFGDGSAFYGEWRGGRMHGRGVFLWPGGE